MSILNSPTLRTIQQQQDRIAQLTSGIFDSSVLKAMDNITTVSSMFESSSFKVLQEQQNSIANMISTLNGSSFYSVQEQMMRVFENPALQIIQEQQQDRVAKLTSGIFDSSMLKAMESITKASSMFDTSAFSALQEQQNSIAAMVSGIFDNPVLTALKEQENDFLKRTSLFDTDTIQKILDDIEISKINETAITQEEKSLIDEALQVISEISPEIGTFIQSLELQNYKKATIFMMIWFIYNILPIYQLYNDVFNSDTHYKVNRDNVRVRLLPNKEDNTNIITKLNKNTYIEKLDSENGWAKVRFEFDDGIEKEGWIYRTMITKMD